RLRLSEQPVAAASAELPAACHLFRLRRRAAKLRAAKKLAARGERTVRRGGAAVLARPAAIRRSQTPAPGLCRAAAPASRPRGRARLYRRASKRKMGARARALDRADAPGAERAARLIVMIELMS